ncbi:MAG: DUF3224 domain-containing protein [Gammaproteobacteria bacterium]|jgi:hypothetical protein
MNQSATLKRHVMVFAPLLLLLCGKTVSAGVQCPVQGTYVDKEGLEPHNEITVPGEDSLIFDLGFMEINHEATHVWSGGIQGDFLHRARIGAFASTSDAVFESIGLLDGEVCGRPGTAVIYETGTGALGDKFVGTWVLKNGTGDLQGAVGSGTVVFDFVTRVGTYKGKLEF